MRLAQIGRRYLTPLKRGGKAVAFTKIGSGTEVRSTEVEDSDD